MKAIRAIADRVKKLIVKIKGPTSANSPAGDTYYGESARNYDEKREKQEYWHAEQKIVEELLSKMPRGTSVLDMPFGTGRFAEFCLNRGLAISGLDSSNEMIDQAKAKLKKREERVEIQKGSALNLPYEDGSFDLVMSIRFLSHVISLKDATVALKELSRVSKKWALLQLRIATKRSRNNPVDYNAIMGDQLTRNEVIKWLGEAGLDVVDIMKIDSRETYYRAIALCSKKHETN